jgi:hypothetical protein
MTAVSGADGEDFTSPWKGDPPPFRGGSCCIRRD